MHPEQMSGDWQFLETRVMFTEVTDSKVKKYKSLDNTWDTVIIRERQVLSVSVHTRGIRGTPVSLDDNKEIVCFSRLMFWTFSLHGISSLRYFSSKVFFRSFCWICLNQNFLIQTNQKWFFIFWSPKSFAGRKCDFRFLKFLCLFRFLLHQVFGRKMNCY